jgi:predicted exporter
MPDRTVELDDDLAQLAEAVDRIARKYEKHIAKDTGQPSTRRVTEPIVTPIDVCGRAREIFQQRKKAWEAAGKPTSGPVFTSYVAASALVQMFCG